MSTIGAEMGQLQSLGQSFTRESQTVAQLVATISGQVEATWWKGPAADRFRSAWESEVAPTMRRVDAGLRQARGRAGVAAAGVGGEGGVEGPAQEIPRRHDALHHAGT